MILYEKRASVILYNLLASLEGNKCFLIPSNVCLTIPLVFIKAHAPFEFVDISPATLCIDEEEVLRRLIRSKDRYAGILFVHTYGCVGGSEAFFSRIKQIDRSLVIIDDRCPGIPSFEGGGDTRADLVLYSTGYAKFVDLGFGGFGFIKEGTPYQRASLPFSPSDLDLLPSFSKGDILPYECNWLDTAGPEVPLDEYADLVKEGVERSLGVKKAINSIYGNSLPESIQLPAAYQDWRFNIRVEEKEILLRDIFAAGLFASSHYRPMDPLKGDPPSPNAQSLFNRIVNLFNDRYFDECKAMRLCDIINLHVQRFADA